MSAKIHAKNGDEIDAEVWTLLQAHKDIVDGKTKTKSGKESDEAGLTTSDEQKPVVAEEFNQVNMGYHDFKGFLIKL